MHSMKEMRCAVTHVLMEHLFLSAVHSDDVEAGGGSLEEEFEEVFVFWC